MKLISRGVEVLAFSLLLNIHSSSDAEDGLVLDCHTKDSHIQIQCFGEEGNGQRCKYFSWDRSASEKSKSAFALSGEVNFQGTASNAVYSFRNGLLLYEVSMDNVCATDEKYWDKERNECKVIVRVSKDAHQISEEVCEKASKRKRGSHR